MTTCKRCHGMKGNHITISGLPAFFPCPDCKGTGETDDDEKEGSMRLWRMNDCDWYMARSLDEAKVALFADSGYAATENIGEEIVDDPREVTAEEMQRLRFRGEEGGKEPECSFAERFAVEVARDGVTARMFASTEY